MSQVSSRVSNRVSIVVPAYNAEPYINECLDSLCKQTLRDIEIICVNDGSTDKTAELIADYAQKDERIVLIDQSNCGVGAARNAGMQAATGDIIMFCDADDTLCFNACELVAQRFEDTSAQVVTFAFTTIAPTPAATADFSETDVHPVLKQAMDMRDAVLDNTPQSVIALLFKENARPFGARIALTAEFMRTHNIHWDEGLTLGDDQFFCFEIYPRSQRTVLMSQQLYCYRMHETSMTHTSVMQPQQLLEKLYKHLACEEAILKDWKQGQFLGLCDERLIEWCIELVLFDVSKLDQSTQQQFWNDWKQCVLSYIAVSQLLHSPRLAPYAKSCLKDICSRQAVVSKRHLSMFYLRQRGLINSIKRVVWGLSQKAKE